MIFSPVSGEVLKRNLSISSPRQANQIMGAICVERCPVITVQKTKIEKEFSDLMNSIEFENSKLSDHELRKIREE